VEEQTRVMGRGRDREPSERLNGRKEKILSSITPRDPMSSLTPPASRQYQRCAPTRIGSLSSRNTGAELACNRNCSSPELAPTHTPKPLKPKVKLGYTVYLYTKAAQTPTPALVML